MPSKKKTTRAAQLQPQPAPSDYDTDTAATDAPPPMAQPPPARTNTELNLLVLRRYVPETERIIAIAPFAVVYLFSPETQQWEKSGHEGTLFVCQLSSNEMGYARYNVVILNRKSLDNFITELVSGEDIEVTEQYVILQVLAEDGTPNIYGLWIFSDDENAPNTREVVANTIQECAIRAEHARAGGYQVQNGHSPVPEYNLEDAAESSLQEDITPVQTQPPGQQIDLLSLFDRPSTFSNSPLPQQGPSAPQQQYGHPARFASSADTDFFRSSNSPAAAVQQQTQPPPQQNALLDLFKSARKG